MFILARASSARLYRLGWALLGCVVALLAQAAPALAQEGEAAKAGNTSGIALLILVLGLLAMAIVASVVAGRNSAARAEEQAERALKAEMDAISSSQADSVGQG
jgi:type VI protein secretion system component VasK